MNWGGVDPNVFIYDTDKNLIPRNKWDISNNSKVVGIAIIDDNTQYVIHPNDSPQKIMFSSQKQEIVGLPTFNQLQGSQAERQFDGNSNTNIIINKIGSSTNYAAGYCRSITFKHGKIGYLWSFGQAYIAKYHCEEIEKCMQLIGGDIFNNPEPYESDRWTSTQMYYDTSWFVDMESWDIGDGGLDKDFLLYVRPIADL